MTESRYSEALRQRVAKAFGYRCAYCRSSQKYTPDTLQIEHIIPRSRGGTDDEMNLCWACSPCNRRKAARTRARDPLTNRNIALFNPRTQEWTRHFRWARGGLEVVGLTACGRATVEALGLNSNLWLTVRSNWIAAGWHPPADT